MKKKNLVILSLIIIMVLSLSLAALAGCDPKEKIPAGYKAMSTQLNEVLETALDNATEGPRVNNLKASGGITFGTQYGDTTSKYKLSFAANVVLKNDTENPDNVTEFGISLIDAKANTNIINMYYLDMPTSATGGFLFVDLGSGADAKHFQINALSIKNVLASENAYVSDDEANKIAVDYVYSKLSTPINDYMGIIGGLGKTYQSLDNSKVLLRLDLESVLNDAGDLLSGLDLIDDYTAELGLAIKSAELQSLLPKLSIDLIFSFDGADADDFEHAIYTGVDVKLNVDSKDFKVQRTDGSNFLRINIAKNTVVELGVDFKFDEDADLDSMPGLLVAQNQYTRMDAINFTTEGELTLNKALGVTLSLGGEDLDIAIPEGTYTIKLALDVDPTKLIGMNFNVKGNDAVLNLVADLVNNVLKTLKVDIADKNNPNDTSKQLKLSIIDGKVTLTNLALLGELGAKFPALNNGNISRVLDIVKGFLPADTTTPDTGSGETPSGSGETASGSGETVSGSGNQTNSGDNSKTMETIADIIKNLTIEVNNGEINAELKNQSVAQNHKLLYKPDPADPSGELPDLDDKGEQKYEDFGDTTLDIKAIVNKSGLTLDAVLNNIVTDFDNYDANKITKVTANIKVDSTGVTITAKSENLSIKGIGELPIDLVLKLTKFEMGNANA